mmetsp:Transcript_15209/g.54116  ORF Transcript_15209/g.54116 Transcript_15209/m.54116 type:complete len:304 (+) Transcript_15209:1-912(+)
MGFLKLYLNTDKAPPSKVNSSTLFDVEERVALLRRPIERQQRGDEEGGCSGVEDVPQAVPHSKNVAGFVEAQREEEERDGERGAAGGEPARQELLRVPPRRGVAGPECVEGKAAEHGREHAAEVPRVELLEEERDDERRPAEGVFELALLVVARRPEEERHEGVHRDDCEDVVQTVPVARGHAEDRPARRVAVVVERRRQHRRDARRRVGRAAPPPEHGQRQCKGGVGREHKAYLQGQIARPGGRGLAVADEDEVLPAAVEAHKSRVHRLLAAKLLLRHGGDADAPNLQTARSAGLPTSASGS